MRPLALSLLLLLVGSPAQAGGLTGTVVPVPGFGDPGTPAADTAFYWEVPNGIVPTVPYRIRPDEEVVATLQGPGLEGAEPTTVDVQIGGPSMLPQSVVIAPGSTVRFINHSGLTVELYSDAVPDFGREPLHTAHMRPVLFPAAGTFEVRCGHHPGFRGWVIVAPGVRSTRIAGDGGFAFTALPGGAYELKLLFRGQPVLTRSVRIAEDAVEALGEVRLGEPPRSAAQVAAAAAASEPAVPTAGSQPAEAADPAGGRGRRRRGRGGAAAAAPAAVEQAPRQNPGELRSHRLSGGP